MSISRYRVTVLRSSRSTLSCHAYSTETTPTAPPLLLKLRGDLKTSLKAKDTNRLNVLRGVLADITNANKTASPMKTDMQILALLRKRAAASKAAADEFAGHGRDDLKAKEMEQASIMDEYAGNVKVMGGAEIQSIVEKVKAALEAAGGKSDKGSLLRKLFEPHGELAGKSVEKKLVAEAVNKLYVR